ncbi:MAG: Fe-S cluster assembly protein SufB, partial [Candidatus Heimdallarchaeota archaeon]|nr:Fe-S cluster assembly protein SufB [Candidatus Heimdallarchaeota archaeon]
MVTRSDISIEYKAGWSDPENFTAATDYGLNEDVVRQISNYKNEPEWMLEFRLDALKKFFDMPFPQWGDDLMRNIDFENLRYYVRYSDRAETSWDDVPDDIKNTFDKLGIPEAERKFLAGVGAQYDSETVYHNLREDLKKQGVVFLDTDTGLKEHPEIFKKYFGTIIPPDDNKFAALNSAVWSGGSFVIIPKGVKVDVPIQAYFRINTKNSGQFERTLIIAEEGSEVHYIEGCTAPTYTTDSLHSAVVELIALPGSTIRYTTIQNWSNNVYNLVTKRAYAYENSLVEWVDGNIGSKLTMKYP